MSVGLVDTSCIVLLDDLDGAHLPERMVMSAVTVAELSAGAVLAVDPPQIAARLLTLQRAQSTIESLPFDDAAAQAFASVSAELRTAGRTRAARSFDVLIAATALSRGLPLYTVNPRDVAGVRGLTIKPVPHPDRA